MDLLNPATDTSDSSFAMRRHRSGQRGLARGTLGPLQSTARRTLWPLAVWTTACSLLVATSAEAALKPAKPLPAAPTPVIPLVPCGTADLAIGTFTNIKVRAMTCGAARKFLSDGATKTPSALYTTTDCTTKDAATTFTSSCANGQHTLEYSGSLP